MALGQMLRPYMPAIGDAFSDLGYGFAKGGFKNGFGIAADRAGAMQPYRDEQAEKRAARERSKANAAFLVGNPALQEMVSSGSIDFKTGYDIWQDMKNEAKPDMQVINGQLVDAKTGKVYGDYRDPSDLQDGGDPTANMREFQYAQDNPEFAEWMKGGQGDPPADIQEYQWYANEELKAGRAPVPYIEFAKAQRDGGTTINMPAIEGQYDKTLGENLAKNAVDIQNQAQSAVGTLTTLSVMEQQMADPNFYSGFGGNQLQLLKQAAVTFGADPASVSSIESFNALSKKAALDVMGGSLGTGFSNADRDFVIQQVPNLGNTPEGNRTLIGIQKKIAQRKIEIAQFAQQYAASHGGRLDYGFQVALAEWAERNPLFPEGPPAGESSPPSGVDPGLWEYLTPEEKRLFQ